MLVARRVERELASEPADARHHAPEPLDRRLARRDVDAGGGVVAAPPRWWPTPRQTPGSAAWYDRGGTGSGRPRVTGVGATGTAVG